MKPEQQRDRRDTPITQGIVDGLKRGERPSEVFVRAVAQVARRITEVTSHPMNDKAVQAVARRGASKRLKELSTTDLLKHYLDEQINGGKHK